jgi:hypothetical protein
MFQRTLNSKRCGIAGAKFAIALPLLFMFLLGMCVLVDIHHTLLAEARETGRLLSAGMPADDAAYLIDDKHPDAGLPTTNVSVVIEKEAERKKLGDQVESWLASFGLTKERYAAVKEKLGLQPACDCTGRQAWLNKWDEKVRNWWRSLLGVATVEEATHVGVSILTQDAHWA